jgi:AcrR family transcriptional regulator
MRSTLDTTRQRILEAAGEVFAQKGFKAATVREICGRVGANLAAVNYYFGDKERLYIEAVQLAHCSGSDEVPPHWPPGTSAVVKLQDFIRLMLTHLLDKRRPGWHSVLMMRELAEPTSACVALVEAYIRPLYETLDGILKELLGEELPASERHLIGFSIVGQCLFYKVHQPISELLVGRDEYQGYDVERLARHITQFSLAGMGQGGAAAQSVAQKGAAP